MKPLLFQSCHMPLCQQPLLSQKTHLLNNFNQSTNSLINQKNNFSWMYGNWTKCSAECLGGLLIKKQSTKKYLFAF